MKKGFTLAEVLIALGIIGVVAVLSMPILMSNYKKRITEVRLQQTWSILNNAVGMAKVTHGDVEGWDFSLPVDQFVGIYLSDVFKNVDEKYNHNVNANGMAGSPYSLVLANGSRLTLYRYRVLGGTYYYLMIFVDINDSQKPNALGLDRFYFYLVPKARNIYNTGTGDALWNVPRAGLYYDGYGLSVKNLKTNIWRGCSDTEILLPNGDKNAGNAQGAYCVALIAKNNWKIPDDYPKKF